MKQYSRTILVLLLSSVAAFATQWVHRELGDLLADADLVVIGQIADASGMTTPPPNERLASLRHIWDSQLHISRILKGNISTSSVSIVWDEINLDRIPPYQPGEMRIWILNAVAGTNKYSTSGRPDTVLRTNDLQRVEEQLKK